MYQSWVLEWEGKLSWGYCITCRSLEELAMQFCKQSFKEGIIFTKRDSSWEVSKHYYYQGEISTNDNHSKEVNTNESRKDRQSRQRTGCIVQGMLTNHVNEHSKCIPTAAEVLANIWVKLLQLIDICARKQPGKFEENQD